MVFLVPAFILMSILMGAAAHTSLPVFLAGSAAIGLWLLAFFVREHLSRSAAAQRRS